jgi:hypothetical protein
MKGCCVCLFPYSVSFYLPTLTVQLNLDYFRNEELSFYTIWQNPGVVVTIDYSWWKQTSGLTLYISLLKLLKEFCVPQEYILVFSIIAVEPRNRLEHRHLLPRDTAGIPWGYVLLNHTLGDHWSSPLCGVCPCVLGLLLVPLFPQMKEYHWALLEVSGETVSPQMCRDWPAVGSRKFPISYLSLFFFHTYCWNRTTGKLRSTCYSSRQGGRLQTVQKDYCFRPLVSTLMPLRHNDRTTVHNIFLFTL